MTKMELGRAVNDGSLAVYNYANKRAWPPVSTLISNSILDHVRRVQ